ncbi:MAG TPA: zf-HC2 domain-containing protein [Pseudonocardiaceae bacterium]
MSGEHGSLTLLESYVRGEDLVTDQVWAIEVHLESCARCRRVVAAAMPSRSVEVLDQVWSAVDTLARPRVHRSAWRRWVGWLSRWASPAMTPWLGMTLVVLTLALLADLAGLPMAPHLSLLTLLAPVAPLLGIAAAWAKGLDPVQELVAATPRAGLYLVLRRTVAVLVVVIPLLLLANWLTGATSVLWLLPCLAFTIGTLALGALIGIFRAAIILIGLWSALVLLPSLATDQLSILLQPTSLPGWIAAVVVGAALLGTRIPAYNRLPSQH